MQQPDRPDPSNVIEYESRSLRDARHLLKNNGIPDAMNFISDNPHPVSTRLGRLGHSLSDHRIAAALFASLPLLFSPPSLLLSLLPLLLLGAAAVVAIAS